MRNRDREMFLLLSIGEISEKMIIDAKNTRVYTVRRLTAAAAAIVLIAAGILSAILIPSLTKPYDTLTIEARFPIELSIDRHQNIISCKADSYQAKQVITQESYRDMPLRGAVEEIVRLLIETQTLTQQQNTVMLSFSKEETADAPDVVREVCEKSGIAPAVLSVKLKEEEYADYAKAHGVSQGKAKLVKKLSDKLDISPSPLTKCRIGELNLIASFHGISFDDITVTGETDDSLIIKADAAKELALNAYHILPDEITELSCSLDADASGLIYTVKLKTASSYYLCLVDAYTGEILEEKRSGSSLDTRPYDASSAPSRTDSALSGYAAYTDSEAVAETDRQTQQETASARGGESGTSSPLADNTAAAEEPVPDMLRKGALSSDSTEGRKLSAQTLGKINILGTNAFSEEHVALVYSKEQMEELISGYNSLKNAPNLFKLSSGDLLSDEFYRENAVAVIIVIPKYDAFEDRFTGTLHFESAYLSGDSLSVNLTDTHDASFSPYAEFVGLKKSDVISVSEIL